MPEIEKEINQTSQEIFGIGKKDVVVSLDEMGICTSLGMKPWKILAECVPGRSGKPGWSVALLARE